MEMSEAENLSFNALYSDGRFEKIRLGALVNKGGAAGKIYLSADNPEQVIRYFIKSKKATPTAKN